MFFHLEAFHDNAKQFCDIISKLNFVDNTFGQEVKNFNHKPDELAEALSHILGRPLEHGENSGVYRKPFPFIHFENWTPVSAFSAAIALEDTTFFTYRHKESQIYNVLQMAEKNIDMDKFIEENSQDFDKWDVIGQINMKQGDLVVMHPWTWHSFDENNLIQVFHFNRKQSSIIEVPETFESPSNIEPPA
jgi:hypothetical protein